MSGPSPIQPRCLLTPDSSTPQTPSSPPVTPAKITPSTLPSKSDRRSSTSSSYHMAIRPEDPRLTNILGSIANLLIQQTELIRTHQEKLTSFEVFVQDRFDELEINLEEVAEKQRGCGLELEIYLNDRVEGLVERLNTLKSTRVNKRKGRAQGQTKAKAIKATNSTSIKKNDTQDDSTMISFFNMEDLIRLESPIMERPETQSQSHPQLQVVDYSQDAFDSFAFDPAIFEVPSTTLGDHAPSSTLPEPTGTLVDQAIEKQRQLLNGESVLKEGENAVGFVFRKRLKGTKGKDNFKIDMSFLDEILIDGQAQADRPEESEDQPLINFSPETDEAGPSNNLRSQITKAYNPFPLTYMRQASLSSVPSSSSSSTADSDDSHLTAIRRGASLVDDKLLLPGTPTPAPVRSRTLSGRKRKRGNGTTTHWTNSKKKRLKKEDKIGKKDVGWPGFGANTIKSRMEEIICDTCGGRVHWACAGLSHGKSMRGTPWSCPNCLGILAKANDRGNGKIPSIPKAQQEKCLRPNCIYRSEKRIVRKNDDVNQYFMEKIIGRKRISHKPGGGNYLYLVKWWDWEIYDSTWEPARNIPDLERYEALFLDYALKTEGTDIYLKNVILLEECSPWIDHKGNYDIELLLSMGVERRQWWDDDAWRELVLGRDED
ncbi:hypothetical protein I302_105139 [Kwoniella bestiolae CBS 10118]|uniref:Chromo domain-containing protein n=1 Tax=Kwoniella bestiolae CBS 10118 TaxID=1296100 RepID=A0A1B9FSA4_9TREE|nr:hypothetical protein I302_08428 [Kwoniella bestiolae CBS 10118]OCF21651.1 hypothetical protein I302_08428 [Kwoniella bestiolae CBS 10118]